MNRMSLARRVHFNAGHRYWNDDWTPEKNKEEFGACTNPEGHGHSYVWDVFIEGPFDPVTGMILNLRDVDQRLRSIIQPIDGQFLNLRLPRFKKEIPTTESLLLHLTEQAQNAFSEFKNIRLSRTRLFETEDLWVEWNAE